jgi:hypothetical protein
MALIAFAFIPFAAAYWHTNRYNWTPLDFPVELHAGEIRTPEIRVDVSGRYVLFLQVQPRKMDNQRETCLLDLELFDKDKCSAIPSVVDVSWTLFRGSEAVADDHSLQSWRGGSFSNNYIRREIGRFEGRQGETYTLSLNFKHDPSELNVARPAIVAEVIQDWDGFALETQGTFVLGVLLAIIGLVLVIGPARDRRKPGL